MIAGELKFDIGDRPMPYAQPTCSVLLFLALAGVMYATRRIDWNVEEAGVVA